MIGHARHRLNQAQRTVTVVALGMALYFLGVWLTGLAPSAVWLGDFTNLNSGSSLEGSIRGATHNLLVLIATGLDHPSYY